MKMKFIVLSCVLFGLFACSSNDKKEELKKSPLVEFSETAKVKKNWSVSVGKGRDKRYSKFLPAVVDDRVYASDTKGSVFAFNLNNGKLLWKTKAPTAISAGVGANSQSVFVGTFSGELIALDAEDGSEKWSSSVSSEILGVPAANESVVVVQTIDGRAFAFDVKSGESLWRYDHSVPSLTLRGTANPTIVRSQVLLAFGNGQLVSLQASDGALKWDRRLSQPKGRTELDKIIDVDTTPFVSGGLVYAANYQGTVGAYTSVQGQPVWRKDLSTYRDLYVSSGKVIAVSADSELMAFNSGSGAEQWKNDQMLARGLGAPAVVGSYVVTIDSDGYMHVVSAVDGSFADRIKPAGKGFSSSIVVNGDAFLVFSDNGTLSSYSIEAI